MSKNKITAERLRYLLSFNSETGAFVWLNPTAPWMKINDVAGCVGKEGYWRIKIDGVLYAASRLAWLYHYGAWPQNCVDHIDGNTANNRINNLRDVTTFLNQQNQRKPQIHNKTGFLGVSYSKKLRKFYAQIIIQEKKKHLGLFATAAEAGTAYLEAKRRFQPGCTI